MRAPEQDTWGAKENSPLCGNLESLCEMSTLFPPHGRACRLYELKLVDAGSFVQQSSQPKENFVCAIELE